MTARRIDGGAVLRCRAAIVLRQIRTLQIAADAIRVLRKAGGCAENKRDHQRKDGKDAVRASFPGSIHPVVHPDCFSTHSYVTIMRG